MVVDSLSCRRTGDREFQSNPSYTEEFKNCTSSFSAWNSAFKRMCIEVQHVLLPTGQPLVVAFTVLALPLAQRFMKQRWKDFNFSLFYILYYCIFDLNIYWTLDQRAIGCYIQVCTSEYRPCFVLIIL